MLQPRRRRQWWLSVSSLCDTVKNFKVSQSALHTCAVHVSLDLLQVSAALVLGPLEIRWDWEHGEFKCMNLSNQTAIFTADESS